MNTRETRNRVEVIDREGWRKEYPLDRAILHIGSDSRNDIVLEGGRGAGIEARHAQLIATAGSRSYRLVNLSQLPIPMDGGTRVLPPRGATDIYDRDVVRIGEHTFHFVMREGTSTSISVSLQLSDTRLTTDSLLDGVITVQNLGTVPGAQFKLAIEGLTPEWYALGPGPILFPGAQKDVLLQIRHARRHAQARLRAHTGALRGRSSIGRRWYPLRNQNDRDEPDALRADGGVGEAG